MELYAWIDDALSRRGRNAVVDLARELKIDKGAVSKIRKNRRQVTANELRIIEAFFGQKWPTGPAAAADDPDRERTEWMERNKLRVDMSPVDSAGNVQQMALFYLVFYTSKIADQLERIASHLERPDSQSSERRADRPAPRGSRISSYRRD